MNLTCRYQTTNRRVIGATVGWGDVATLLGLKGSLLTLGGCLMHGYKKASITTMVMGNLLARFKHQVETRLSGPSLKTFCIGFSLGGQLCGFAGKYSRQ